MKRMISGQEWVDEYDKCLQYKHPFDVDKVTNAKYRFYLDKASLTLEAENTNRSTDFLSLSPFGGTAWPMISWSTYSNPSPSKFFNFFDGGRRLEIYYPRKNKNSGDVFSGLWIDNTRNGNAQEAYFLTAEDPTEDGTYTLKLVKSGSSITYKWVKDVI